MVHPGPNSAFCMGQTRSDGTTESAFVPSSMKIWAETFEGLNKRTCLFADWPFSTFPKLTSVLNEKNQKIKKKDT